MAWFRAFPAGFSIQWQGATQPMPAGPALMHGKGILRILNPAGAEIGCYVGLLDHGLPQAGLQRIKRDPSTPPVAGLQLGDQPWDR